MTEILLLVSASNKNWFHLSFRLPYFNTVTDSIWHNFEGRKLLDYEQVYNKGDYIEHNVVKYEGV